MSLQRQIWLHRAGLLNEKKEHLSDEEINKILKRLRAEDEEELEKMQLENYFGEDEDLEELSEETTTKEPVKGKVSSDTKGKLHELLVGYHLNGAKHMEKHPDKHGDTPEEAHDKLAKTVHPDDYVKMNNRARSAANHIRKQVEANGHKIHQVHWTSQPNDLLRTTGIKATQKEDSSDIVVTTHKK